MKDNYNKVMETADLPEEDVIEISSSEDTNINSDKFTNTFLGKIAPKNGTVSDERCTLKIFICRICAQPYKDTTTFGAHLFNSSACFFPLTESMWHKEPHEQQVCRICNVDLSSELMLKNHCFERLECRLGYIALFSFQKEYQGKSIPSLDILNPKVILETSTSNLSSQYIDNSKASASAKALIKEVDNRNCDISIPRENGISVPDYIIEADNLKGMDTSSKRKAENSNLTAFVPTASVLAAEFNFNRSLPKRQLRSCNSKHRITCPGCRRKFDSKKNKKKHLSASVKCRQILESLKTISCLHCRTDFTSEEKKTEHLILSPDCHMFLKNSFLNRKFVSETSICDNYSLNKNMCSFCLFTADKGDVFDHVLSSQKCRKELEEAVLEYNKQSKTLSAESELEQIQGPGLTQLYSCNVCNSSFITVGSLKIHKMKTHSSPFKHRWQQGNEHCVLVSDHLYCFSCKKFLKSEKDVRNHKCKLTRLLSRFWYRKATWNQDEYQCISCSEKFFHTKTALEKHMYHHEKKRSPLFNFVSNSSTQNELSCVNTFGATKECTMKSSEVCEFEDVDTTSLNMDVESQSKTDVSSNRKITKCQNVNVSKEVKFVTLKVLQKSRKVFTCENCHSNFDSTAAFQLHVLSSKCLMYYENPRNSSPFILPFCFKCKEDFKHQQAFMEHKCIGLVLIKYKCALCAEMFSSIINLRDHENSNHKSYKQYASVEEYQASCDVERINENTARYNCNVCQATFNSSSHFVMHISQVHEQANQL